MADTSGHHPDDYFVWGRLTEQQFFKLEIIPGGTRDRRRNLPCHDLSPVFVSIGFLTKRLFNRI
ncbi:hypothetical protein [Paraburkholderia strydomiana]|uniref:hypothetical protein n=1 Tax=Paraburkholderia strydomiana TaxID=1245417 RepID=UPI0038B8E355